MGIILCAAPMANDDQSIDNAAGSAITAPPIESGKQSDNKPQKPTPSARGAQFANKLTTNDQARRKAGHSQQPDHPEQTAHKKGKQNWHGRTRGGLAMVAFGTSTMRWVGWRPTYILVYIFSAFYILLAQKPRRESIRWWRHIHPNASYLDHWRWAYQHFVGWGRVCCDRQLFYSSKEFSYDGSGLDRMRAMKKQGGAIILSAHVGNWELAAARMNAFSEHDGKRAHIVRIIDDDPLARQIIENHMRDQQPVLIDPRNPMGASFAIRKALMDGCPVCMLGDRQLDLQQAVSIPFLGESANFSTGPFLMAGLTGAPVFTAYFVKKGRKHYHIDFRDPIYVDLPKKGPQRDAYLKEIVSKWVADLESVVRAYPNQWHNWFNIWE